MSDPCDVAAEWDGHLRPIEFTTPKPLLPAATVSFLHFAGVPTRFEVTSYQIVRFEFLTTPANLADTWSREMPDYSFPAGWGRLWQIGDITYTQAAAWLCVEELSGRLVAVDVEIDDPQYTVNESIEGMVRCMRVLYDWAQATGGSLAHVASLRSALAHAPAIAEGEATHYWLPMVDSAVESRCGQLEVAYE
jgi:hypothetical protein